jgi:hypothetical protein
MKLTLLTTAILLTRALPGFNYSVEDIDKLAAQVNQKIKRTSIGNGIIARDCSSVGKILILQFDIPFSWKSPNFVNNLIITNFKTTGAIKAHYENIIHLDYNYDKGNALVKKVSIKTKDLSRPNFTLGEHVSIKNHPKAKGVNMKLRVPIGWEVKEGNRPNIVKKFTYDGDSFMILVLDNVTFYSRKKMRETLQDDKYVDVYVQEFSETLSQNLLKNSQVLDYSVVTVDTYPAIQIKIQGTVEHVGITMPIIIKCWAVFYEDKIILLQGMGLQNSEFRKLETLYTLITNSVVFPDQYND